MNVLGTDSMVLGLGCWPIGGEMYSADGQSLGYSNTDDKESTRAVHAALANGITVFDTAAAYGAGHSERLLGASLRHSPDAKVITKIGIAIDENTKTLNGEEADPDAVLPAIDRCLLRLQRESIDLVLLHLNALPVDKAELLFQEMEKAMQAGKVKSFGWSTDFTTSARAMADKSGFVAIEYAMNVFMDAPAMQQLVNDKGLYSIIRSPLAMGLLSGKYHADSAIPSNDIRATNQGWANYYQDGQPNPELIKRFNAVRELLQSDGRSAVQGALAWLWSRSPSNIPVPGARTVQQVEELAAARSFGALSDQCMKDIDSLIGKEFISEGESER